MCNHWGHDTNIYTNPTGVPKDPYIWTRTEGTIGKIRIMILPLPQKFGQLLKQVDLERYGTWSALVSALKRAGRCVFILSLSHFIHVLVRDFWRQIRTPFTKCAISRHWVLYLICSLKWIKVKKISDSTKKSLSKSIKPIPSYDFTKIVLWIKAPDWSTRKNSQSDWLENWRINFGAIFYGFFSLICKYLNNEKWSWPDFFCVWKPEY